MFYRLSGAKHFSEPQHKGGSMEGRCPFSLPLHLSGPIVLEAPEGFELEDCLSVARSIHRLFRPDQGVHHEHAKLHAFNVNQLTGLFDLLVGAYTLNFAFWSLRTLSRAI
jgi:hypothetical protein